jgi:hypothetical protein
MALDGTGRPSSVFIDLGDDLRRAKRGVLLTSTILLVGAISSVLNIGKAEDKDVVIVYVHIPIELLLLLSIGAVSYYLVAFWHACYKVTINYSKAGLQSELKDTIVKISNALDGLLEEIGIFRTVKRGQFERIDEFIAHARSNVERGNTILDQFITGVQEIDNTLRKIETDLSKSHEKRPNSDESYQIRDYLDNSQRIIHGLMLGYQDRVGRITSRFHLPDLGPNGEDQNVSQIQEKINASASALVSIKMAFEVISSSVYTRDRRMFRFYEQWVTYTFAIFAVIAGVCSLTWTLCELR